MLTDEIDVWHRRVARMLPDVDEKSPRLDQVALRNALGERSWHTPVDFNGPQNGDTPSRLVEMIPRIETKATDCGSAR